MNNRYNNDYLMHYGVKGMKWGVRHQPVRIGRRGAPIGGNASNSRRKANAKKWLKRGAIIAGAGIAAYGAYYLYKSGNSGKLISLGKSSIQSTPVPRIDTPRSEVKRVNVPRIDTPRSEVKRVNIPRIDTPRSEVKRVNVPRTNIETFTPETINKHKDTKITQIGDTSKWENLIKQNSDLLNKTLDDLLKN